MVEVKRKFLTREQRRRKEREAQQIKKRRIETIQSKEVLQNRREIEKLRDDFIKRREEIKRNDRITNKKKRLRDAGNVIKAYQQVIEEINKGKLISKQEAKRFANEVVKGKRRLREARVEAVKLKKASKVIPKQKLKSQTITVITNPEVFLNSQSDKYLKAKGSERKKIQQNLIKSYGKDTLSKVIEVANLKRDSKKFTIQDIQKIGAKLQKRTSRVTVSEVPIFKLQVNTLLKEQKKSTIKGNFKPLPLTASLPKYTKELKRLNKFNEDIKKKITEVKKIDLKQFKPGTFENIENKLLTKQTVTPKEKQVYLAQISKSNKNLTTKQLNLGKKIVLSPVNYGRSLVIRNQAGEKNPLFNDTKSFVIGVKKGAVDPLVDLVKGTGKLSIKTVNSAFNYGKRLSSEAQKGKFILDDDIIKLVKTTTKGAKTTADKINKLQKFVRKYPLQSALIAGTIAGATISTVSKKSISLYKSNPPEFLGQAVGILFGQVAVIKTIGLTVRTLSKLNPAYVKEVNGVFKLKNKKLWTSVKDFLKGKKKQIPKEYAKNPDLILKSQTVKSGSRSLAEQTAFAGKEVTAVNAAAVQITSWINRKQLIRKPIPGEKNFPAIIKKALAQFDSTGKLPKKTFAMVNKWLQKNVAPNITLLERSLYLDPTAGLRVSRLGINKEKTASLLDIFRGNFRLKGDKPQVLIFENAKVANFPKQLKDIEKKLKANKKLTTAETNRLIAWQVKTGSGKFKPIGSTIYAGGKELEVTLAPGEFIKRIKRVGFTYIKGKKVDFVTAEVYKPSKDLLDKVNKANKGKLTDKEILALEKELSKKLGRKMRVETPKTRASRVRSTTQKPVLRVSGKTFRIIETARRTLRASKRTTKAPPRTTKAPPRTLRASKRTTKAPPRTLRASKRTTKAPSRTTKAPPRTLRASKRTTKAPPRTLRAPSRTTKAPSKTTKAPKLKFDSKLPKGTRLKYDIKFKERGNVKTRKLGLPLNAAIKRGFGAVDRTTQASAQLIIVGTTKAKDIASKDVQRLKSKFTIRKGKDKTVLRFVEKNKNRIDTQGEKKGLKLSKVLKKKKKK